MPIEQVTVPDIGGAEGAEVIEVLVAIGDQVTLDQSLIVLESDKASMEIPSTVAGTVVELLVKEGDQLAEGAPIIKVEVASGAAQEASSQGESGVPAGKAANATANAAAKTASPSDQKTATPESPADPVATPEAESQPNGGKDDDEPAEREPAKDAQAKPEPTKHETAEVAAGESSASPAEAQHPMTSNLHKQRIAKFSWAPRADRRRTN